MNIKSILFGTTEQNETRTDLGLLVLRVFTGLSMAFAHGLGKVPPSEGFIKGVSNMGFPAPDFFAWMAGLSEFAGGLLIAIGLMTRPSAFFMAITMFVAAFIRHGDDPFGGKEKALLFAVIAIMLIFTGAGRYSIDDRIKKF